MAFTKVALLSLLSLVAARDALQSPTERPVIGDITPQGCFNSLPSQVDGRSNTFNSVGSCADYCQEQKKTVAILKDVECICADIYPAKSALVDDDKCDTPCPGYPKDACGGGDAYSVFNLGVDMLPGNEGDKRSSGSTSSTEIAAVTTATEVSTTDAEATSASPTTVAKDETTSVTNKADKASATEATTSGSTAASTPSASASSVPDNASRRLNNPIGNLVGLLRQLL
ncbi:hypothetical protein FGADI_2518 [Fusarium gaditjirri]|uniref:WSC domain-containing protein n=1 Tax=Fusarium gaditjirri TaxID=282569 RepID=A0A8H4X1E7_9HYPO|nr:hypothetical protein FGADI_2518 [Fusarium gaditjirri]